MATRKKKATVEAESDAPEQQQALMDAPEVETPAEPAAETKTAPEGKGKKGKNADAARAAGVKVIDQFPVDTIILDPDIQPRESVSATTVSEYRESMENGDEFPPVVIFRESEGADAFAADGWHRILAAKAMKRGTILADIREGTKRDAILFSVGANATHGLRRTDADKRKAVMRLLRDEEWSKLSANVIAQRVGVSQPFVSKMKKDIAVENGQEADSGQVKTADGRVMDTTRIGRPPKPRPETVEEEPDIPMEPTPLFGGQTEEPAAPFDLRAEAEAEVNAARSVEDSETDDDEDDEPSSPELAFGRLLLSTLKRMKDFDGAAVFGAMSDDECQEAGDAWDEILRQLDGYSAALEERLG